LKCSENGQIGLYWLWYTIYVNKFFV